MRRPLVIIISVVVIFLLLGTLATSMLGFGANRSATSTDFFGGYGMGGGGGAPDSGSSPSVVEAPAEPAYDSANAAKSGEAFNGAAQAPQERLVIVNVDMGLVVQDPKARMTQISQLATAMGGYVVSSNIYETNTSLGKQVPEATVVVRIPAEKLEEALTQIKKDAVDIPYENRSGQDVTNVYVDLQSQLKAKQAAEQKLLEIMDTAEKAEDVLAIYIQVQTVQTEIEQLKGQIQYYEESAALSSVSVRLIAEEGTQPIEVGPWKPEGAAKAAVEDLIRFVQNFTEFLIRFGIFTLPALVLIVIPLYLVFLAGRAVYRRSRKSKVVVEETEVKK
jgi:hypothetical protein